MRSNPILFAFTFLAGYLLMKWADAPSWACIIGGWVLWILARPSDDS